MKSHLDRYFSEDFAGRAETTIRTNKEIMKIFFEFLGSRTIDTSSYSAWVEHVTSLWSPKRVTLALTTTGRFLSWCERQKLIPMPAPHRLVRRPRQKPGQDEPREPFTPEEYKALVTFAEIKDPDMAWAIRLGWECGLALVDACVLQWDNFYPAETVLRLRRQKTNESCLIPLVPDGSVLEKLRLWKDLPRQQEWPNKPPLVYYVRPSLAASYIVARAAGFTGLQIRFKKIRDKALPGCKEKTFHNLRASFCSAIANGGMNLAAACRITGHKDPRVFQQYFTPDVEQLREQMLKAKKANEYET